MCEILLLCFLKRVPELPLGIKPFLFEVSIKGVWQGTTAP